jgi:hypothetical protein
MQEFHFPTWVNKFTVLLILGGLGVAGYLATCLFAAIHPTVINVGHKPKQTVPFSHKLHAGQLKLDCRYCHNTVEQAGHAAVPPSATCGNCHGGNRTTGSMVDGSWQTGRDLGVVHPESTLLTPIRTSLEDDNKPVQWERVHDLPDFVFFNHAAHISRGVSCVSCHGRIDQMDVVEQKETLSMKWCLDCHRNPAPHIRDPQLVTQLDLKIEDPEANGKEWIEKLDINPNVSCSTCHR